MMITVYVTRGVSERRLMSLLNSILQADANISSGLSQAITHILTMIEINWKWNLSDMNTESSHWACPAVLLNFGHKLCLMISTGFSICCRERPVLAKLCPLISNYSSARILQSLKSSLNIGLVCTGWHLLFLISISKLYLQTSNTGKVHLKRFF